MYHVCRLLAKTRNRKHSVSNPFGPPLRLGQGRRHGRVNVFRGEHGAPANHRRDCAFNVYTIVQDTALREARRVLQLSVPLPGVFEVYRCAPGGRVLLPHHSTAPRGESIREFSTQDKFTSPIKAARFEGATYVTLTTGGSWQCTRVGSLFDWNERARNFCRYAERPPAHEFQI